MDRARRSFAIALGGVLLGSRAHAQSRTSYRIGFLSPAEQTYQVNFWDALRTLGYREGENLIAERRFAAGNDERLPGLAAELAGLGVNVIVATNSTATAAVIKATKTIPIVMVTGGDPVEAKYVASYARPGGNVTGTTSFASDIGLKELQLLREALPKVKRIAALADRHNPSHQRFLADIGAKAELMGIAVEIYATPTPAQLQASLAAIANSRAEALLVPTHPVTIAHRKDVIAFAAEHRLPAVYGLKEFTEDGGLMSFGVNFAELYRRAAHYVDQVLKGARPADLAVEQPSKFELVVNLKTARTLRITLPQSILLRADRTID